jgi:hypothetical protein
MKTASLFSAGFAWALLLPLAKEGYAETIDSGRYRFTVLAGAPGTNGYMDGVGATARFDHPGGIAVDASGNVYVSERHVCTIRKISPEGVATTFAGTPGQPGSRDGAGLTARFHTPTELAVDGAGNVYVADTGNHTIRKIDPAGLVTTVAGKAAEPGYINGAKPVARLNAPRSIAIDDAGNVLFTDSHGEFGRERPIRRVAPDGTVSNLALSGRADLFDYNIQQWVRADRIGNVYVMILHSGPFNDIVDIEKLTPAADGTYVPGTIFTDLIWAELTRIDLDGKGNLFIKDADGPLLIYTPNGESQIRYPAVVPDTQYEFAVGRTGEIYFVGGLLRGGALEVGVFDPAAKGAVLLGQPLDVWTRIGFNAGFWVVAAGGPTLSFQWHLNSIPIAGATGFYYNISNAQDRDAGNYSVIVTDGAGSWCTRSVPA